MEALTFEQLPGIVSTLANEVRELRQAFNNKQEQPAEPQDELLTVQQAAQFLTLSVPTIYGLISKGELPVMKRSKRCYFSKVELLNYLKQGRKRTSAETASEGDAFLSRRKKKGGYHA